MNGKNVLVLGGTGAMGVYLVPELADRGYQVDVISLDDVKSDRPDITYRVGDCKNDDFILQVLTETHYDAVVDFMLYFGREDYAKRYALMMEHTDHYITLSTYRVYSDKELPTKETSPRLLDVSQDKDFLATELDEYSLYKARQEDAITSSGYKNWTILRPAITFSKTRFQLTTMEANIWLWRALNGKTVLLPEGAMQIEATMSWAGDVAKMIAGLVLNPKAYGEKYSVCTAEHQPWAQVAQYYEEILGMKYKVIPTEDYIQLMGGTPGARYQLLYDRCLNRVMDNSKILEAAGMKQEDLTPIKEALAKELANLPAGFPKPAETNNAKMDAYAEAHGW